ncbi:MAG: Asp-tRNA(Asn)/Glu-tRNA(Gln) amidotransferase subunit GatB [Oscillospiraceae bacterium]|jgi:aspartyl-tRNA(Asn)/glutamyl-tRNA(Gln) amidotransferase subunit B|nr:Asp-tRNA(Asn)/Glu-tRNA(Gln) amidotransferase subunit GatB [Oscillospiraceae bacterium]
MNWETVIGLEVHAELSAASKIFCGCATTFGGEPNTRVCPVCAGMPGTLPKLNRAVAEYAVRVGLALNCEITRHCKFDRKNYFYPDLPKAYQVSQLYAPICREGRLTVVADGKEKSIGIREIHMEEDAGKLVHDCSGNRTFMDFNRCGVPLLEIVTHPDFQSGAEVIAYLEKLRETLLYLGVCDCKMQEGSLRVDVNLSVRRTGGEMGVRTEMKNLNSFKAIGRAIDYETKRQIEILGKGGRVYQETRRWDDENGVSYGMRSKENAQDYRYFPEPDLLPIEIDDQWLKMIKGSLPELAHEKRERYINDYKISEKEAFIITTHKNISGLFETVSELSGNPLESAHLVTGEIMRLLNQTDTLPEDLSLDGRKLAALVNLVSDGKINRNAYRETVEAVFTRDVIPEEYIAENGLMMINDDEAVIEAVKTALSENSGAVADYRAGKEKAFGFLMGQVMKRLGGSGNPDMARKALKDALK